MEVKLIKGPTEYEKNAGSWLGAGFSVKNRGDYLVAVSAALGVCALVEEGNPDAAVDDLTKFLKAEGLDAPVLGFKVSSPSDANAMFAELARTVAGRPPLSPETTEKILKVAGGPEEAIRPRRSEVPHSTLAMIEACVSEVVGPEGAMITGLRIPPADLVSPTFFLPAILVTAANSWAMPVAASGDRGGFMVRIRKDPEAILGYKVVDIDAAAPLLLFVPIANSLRNAFQNGDCILDSMVETFAWFLQANGLDEEAIEDVEVKVATS